MGQPGDVVVINTLSIQNNGPAPIVRTEDGLGTPKNVADLAARDAIPSYVREEGMTAWVIASSELYRLQGGVANANWVLQSTGASGGTIATFTMGAGIAVRDLVTISTIAADTVNRADASNGLPAVGMVTAINTPAAGQCQVLVGGGLVSGFVGLTQGGVYLMAASAGGVVLQSDTVNVIYPDTTPGSGHFVQPVAVAKSPTELLLKGSLFGVTQ